MFNFEYNNRLQIKANNFLLGLLIVIAAGGYSTRITAAVCTANNKTQIVKFGDISVDYKDLPETKLVSDKKMTVRCRISGQHIYVKTITGVNGDSPKDNFYKTSLSGVRFKWELQPSGVVSQVMKVGSLRGIGTGNRTLSSKFYIEIGNDVKSGTVEEIIITMADTKDDKEVFKYKIPEFNVTARSCEITAPVVNVPMGAVLKSHFKNIGDTAGGRSFEINVQCKGSPNANITWEPGKTDTNGVINADATSSATGVGIQILDDKSNPVKFGEQQDLGTINSSKILSYTAKYYQTSNTVTAGSVNATATFTVDYK
ncbi:fimbrial protein [Xenorhabdus cabanillasii]|uniref:Fimbrial adhesin n=1 Tax=Xenorhabdus cabanillasii JM26 TaxID=1427517 RepID=W1IQL3_9GAMM|nr:fimbrial protein [Xenorhabdus cabanillasii]PHM78032.1 major fimbrial subunit protein [Xenorhabdus cabanillasii JM26]CDL80133.1 putative Fimbrial adhesin [Xenorhabdus cabanillasii JM26]